jgi:hypothetical protein
MRKASTTEVTAADHALLEAIVTASNNPKRHAWWAQVISWRAGMAAASPQ